MVSKTQIEHKLARKWSIDKGVTPKAQTQTNKKMTNRYRCNPKNSNWNHIDKKMVDQYRCDPKTQPQLIGRWSIDIGVALQLKLTRKWPINIGVVPTQTNKTMTDRYRCSPKTQIEPTREWPIGPNSNSTDMKMKDQYMCGLKTQIELTREWSIDIGVVPIQTQLTGRWSIDIGVALKLKLNWQENDRSI